MRLFNIPRCFECGSSHEPGTTAFSKLSSLIAGLACYCLGSRACNCCARFPWWQFCVGKMSKRHSVRHPSHVVIARRDVSDNRKAKETLAGVALADCPTIHLTSLSAASQPKRQVHHLTYTFLSPKTSLLSLWKQVRNVFHTFSNPCRVYARRKATGSRTPAEPLTSLPLYVWQMQMYAACPDVAS